MTLAQTDQQHVEHYAAQDTEVYRAMYQAACVDAENEDVLDAASSQLSYYDLLAQHPRTSHLRRTVVTISFPSLRPSSAQTVGLQPVQGSA